jgi:23S rRNA (guanosine2251-2'-O)-methyltransferase
VWIYGFHPVREALRHRPHQIAEVWVAVRRGGGRGALIEALASRHGVALRPASSAEIAEVAGGEAERVHNGFAARLTEVGEGERRGADPDLVVLVEDVQDPRNLGALLRVCEGAGVDRVLVRDRGSAPLSPVVVKASAGAAEWLPVERVPNTVAALERLQAEGYWVYGADASGEAAWDVDLTGKVVLCFGGEEKGLRRLTRERCDRLISLPMRGRVESLNLATAAAAILYEAVRQRRAKPPSAD